MLTSCAMTNYNAWEKKANALEKDAEKDDEEEKKKADEALGLQDGPQGPPTAKAKEQREEMGGHSTGRKNFIAAQQAREVVVTHKDKPEPIVITQEEGNDRALRLRDCENVSIVLGKDITLLKLFIERCKNLKVELGCTIKTSFLEINHSSDCEVRCIEPVSITQCDECTGGPVSVIFLEPENVGQFYHQNCPALHVAVQGQDPVKIGKEGAKQVLTRPGPSGEFLTEDVVRGEKEFPTTLGRPKDAPFSNLSEPEAERGPVSEENRAKAEVKRVEGNEAFKASDYLQAAVYYTEATQICPDLHLAWANRAQCFLKTGQAEKALEDSVKCTELAPDYAKGWFRKGMALHAMERFAAAIPALCEAEKLDPKNPQIPEAIKMAQMMCRKKGPGNPYPKPE